MNYQINDLQLLRLADLNHVEFWTSCANWVANSEITRQGDIVMINSAVEFEPLSLAFNISTNNEIDPESFMCCVKGFFQGRKGSFSLALRAHQDQALIQHCRNDSTMFEVGTVPGMVLDQIIQDNEIPQGAELYWVNNADMLKGFKDVVGDAYEDLLFPKDVCESLFDNIDRLLEPNVMLALVLLNGQPASTAFGILSHGIAGIYWVGTKKFARGLGLAEYCNREVGNAAFACGARKVILQASKFGEPLYKKMGYREFTQYTNFFCPSK